MNEENLKNLKEEGSAQIILDLTDSKITMRHSDGTLLKSWNELRKQEALERYHALIKYSISHDKRDTVVTIPKYEEIK